MGNTYVPVAAHEFVEALTAVLSRGHSHENIKLAMALTECHKASRDSLVKALGKAKDTKVSDDRDGHELSGVLEFPNKASQEDKCSADDEDEE